MSRLRMATSVGLMLSVGVAVGGLQPVQVRQVLIGNASASGVEAGGVSGSLAAGLATGTNEPGQAPIWTNRASKGFEPQAKPHAVDTPGRGHDFECSPLAVPEGEPPCGDGYVDTYNGGCDSTPPAFQDIACTSIILGQSGTYLAGGDQAHRDTDWYQIVLTDATRLTYSVLAEFPVQILLIDGSGGCEAAIVLGAAVADPCKTAVIDQCVPAGTYWLWVGPSVFEGVACEAEYCAEISCEPCTPPPDIACPPDSYVGVHQLAYGQGEPWQMFVSNDRFPGFDPANGILLYEHFAGVGVPPGGGGIQDIHWWGVGATYDDAGNLVECPLEPGQFYVAFWAHNEYTNRPLYEPDPVHYPGVPAPLYEFHLSAADVQKVDTGHRYRVLNDDGSVKSEYTLWSWGVDLPIALPLFGGWISIQNSDDCAFWWASSPGPPSGQGGIHIQEDDSVSPPERHDVDGDLSWCLTSDDVGPFTGCCCAVDTGQKRATTADDCTGEYDVWYGGEPCSSISCTPEEWACCDRIGCAMLERGLCTGDWWRYYVCSTTDPLYDPDAFGGEGNLKLCFTPPWCSVTCDSPAAFSRALTGGYLYHSMAHDYPGDQQYVIDNFTGFSGAINRIKWWGNSAQLWDGPDCDFDQPAPFVVKFYHTSGDGPDCANPSRVYDPIYATWEDTGYLWTGTDFGQIECYSVLLPSTYMPGTGTQWISIASKSEDCDYIWAPGADGTSGYGQWFYDNGVCTPEPGLRHRCFCLHTNIRTGACCNELTGVCANSVQEATCLTIGGTFYQAMRCIQIPSPGCYAHSGACCDHTGTGSCTITPVSECTGADQVWLGKDKTCDQCCVVACPEGATPEPGDPCSEGYVDPNPGCNAEYPTPDDFTPIADGEVICGMAGTYDGDTLRDTDWYRYELTDPCAVVRAKVKAEFAPEVMLVVGQCFSDSWCGEEQKYVLAYSQATGGPCEYATAAAPLLGPNYYYIMVSCRGVGVPCETPYTLEIEKLPAGWCTIAGDGELCSQAVCLALGGTWEDASGAPCCYEGSCAPVTEEQCAAADGHFKGYGKSCGDEQMCECMARGDANCDGAVNGYDIDPFVFALTNPRGWDLVYPCDINCATDINQDGVVNGYDIDPFVQCLTAGGCPGEP